MPSYTHKMAMYHHHVFCDVISPDVYLSVILLEIESAPLSEEEVYVHQCHSLFVL